MSGITLVDLRALSQRSRRTVVWGVSALTASIAFMAAALATPDVWRETVALAGILGAGLLLVRFAFVAGQERGAFRRLFRAASRKPSASPAGQSAIADESTVDSPESTMRFTEAP